MLFPENCIARGIRSLKEEEYGEKLEVPGKLESFTYTKLITNLAHYLLHEGIVRTKEVLLQIKMSINEILEQPDKLNC